MLGEEGFKYCCYTTRCTGIGQHKLNKWETLWFTGGCEDISKVLRQCLKVTSVAGGREHWTTLVSSGGSVLLLHPPRP